MRSRTILDCERDVKGVHLWVHVRGCIFWCHKCGCLGEEQVKKDGTVKGGLSRFKILRRVQE